MAFQLVSAEIKADLTSCVATWNYTAGQSSGLGPVGKQILPLIDFVHAHIMPYYHSLNVPGSWDYIPDQMHWDKNCAPVSLVISEVK
jgi:hypothetical protein